MRIEELALATGIDYQELTRSLYALTLIELVVPADQVPKPTPAAAESRPQRATKAGPEPPTRPPAAKIPEEVRAELMELVLNHRRRDPFDLLGVDPDRATTTAHLRFLTFAEKLAPWRYEDSLAEEARDVFLAGARAYAHLCDPDRHSALIKERNKATNIAPKATITNQFRLETDLLDAKKQFREGLQLAKSGDLTRALNQLEFAADLNPQNALFRSELAFCRYRLDPEANAKAATEELSAAIPLDPRCGLAL